LWHFLKKTWHCVTIWATPFTAIIACSKTADATKSIQLLHGEISGRNMLGIYCRISFTHLWFCYSALIYLNDDFEGGEFIFADENENESVSFMLFNTWTKRRVWKYSGFHKTSVRSNGRVYWECSARCQSGEKGNQMCSGTLDDFGPCSSGARTKFGCKVSEWSKTSDSTSFWILKFGSLSFPFSALCTQISTFFWSFIYVEKSLKSTIDLLFCAIFYGSNRFAVFSLLFLLNFKFYHSIFLIWCWISFLLILNRYFKKLYKNTKN